MCFYWLDLGAQKELSSFAVVESTHVLFLFGQIGKSEITTVWEQPSQITPR